ncbi:hypothetical protein [uncultured Paraglaciecola sp.]|uniref:hypothetical protein n=1 Tax=uncultured Paraglaciecola sp. TaxID=1765024 RepID=UPI0030DA98CB|tara:strand:- start:58961 stop:59407 length:447 start_codon:yes stop_codon:yes gene_type:complete
MEFLTKTFLPILSLTIFSISPVLAQEMISYQVKIYQLPKGDIASVEMVELIKRSDLIHQPTLLVKPNEEAKIEIGVQDIRTLEIALKSDLESTFYAVSISQKQTNVDEVQVMSSSIPNISMGAEMHWRVSNTDWRYFIMIKGEVVEHP